MPGQWRNRLPISQEVEMRNDPEYHAEWCDDALQIQWPIDRYSNTHRHSASVKWPQAGWPEVHDRYLPLDLLSIGWHYSAE